jgi:hypothetical protein
MPMDPHERTALERQYQKLFEMTNRTENAARDAGCNPIELDPAYPTLCRELEAVTLKLSRVHSTATQISNPIR